MNSNETAILFGGNLAHWQYGNEAVEVAVDGPITQFKGYFEEGLIAFFSGAGANQHLTGFTLNGQQIFSTKPPGKGQFHEFCSYFDETFVVVCAYYEIGWNQGYFAFSPKNGELRFLHEAR
jgi:hypothetical protein